jgi:hypothetical protein
MSLGAVTKGRVERPRRIVLVGTEGIGKSTFAGQSPTPIFLGAEDGTSELDVTRLPEPRTWDDALDAIHLLTVEEHDYKTFVVDTLDWLEPLCWAHVCALGKKSSIEEFGYGKGYVEALDKWRIFLSRLDALRSKRSMGVILIAHSWIKPFKNPEGEDFDRYEMKLHAKASGLIKEWADAVLFAHYETFAAASKEKRAKGVSTGARLIHTTRTAAWDAKNRYGLPDSLPLSWDDFDAAVRAGVPADPAAMRAEIEELLARVDEDTRDKARAWLDKNTRATDLAQMANRLRAKTETTIKEEAQAS